MIPTVVAPLTGLRVLVTRPAPQAHTLAANLAALGAEPLVLPTIAIEPLTPDSPGAHDLVVFVSVHAVEYGARLVQREQKMRVAAIGKATAAALAAAGLPADIVPSAGFTSEALLAHPDLDVSPGQRVLIVRGVGGRETLHDAFVSRGSSVTVLEVYQRVRPMIDSTTLAQIEREWSDPGIDIVTATSAETFGNLCALLTANGRELLQHTALLAPSQRIIDAAAQTGWCADALISPGADDASLIGTLARWRARARTN